MKKLINVTLVLCCVMLLFACKKTSSINNNIVYEETLKDIEKQEPILLAFNSNTSNTRIMWTATPNTGVTISSVNNTATISFEQAGNYVIQANDNGQIGKYYVTVKDVAYSNYGSSFNLIAPKFYNINANEPLVFKAVNVPTGATIAWSVAAQNGYSININSDNTATVSFAGTGFGQVRAIANGVTISRTVWVNDIANPTNDKENVSFILGDKLVIKPSKKTINGVNYIQLQATTIKNYHCSSDAILSYSYDDNITKQYIVDYSAVSISKQPCSPTNFATAINSFKQFSANVYPFIVNFKNRTYTGTVTIDAANGYHFTWNDNSEVDIIPRNVP